MSHIKCICANASLRLNAPYWRGNSAFISFTLTVAYTHVVALYHIIIIVTKYQQLYNMIYKLCMRQASLRLNTPHTDAEIVRGHHSHSIPHTFTLSRSSYNHYSNYVCNTMHTNNFTISLIKCICFTHNNA